MEGDNEESGLKGGNDLSSGEEVIFSFGEVRNDEVPWIAIRLRGRVWFNARLPEGDFVYSLKEGRDGSSDFLAGVLEFRDKTHVPRSDPHRVRD